MVINKKSQVKLTNQSMVFEIFEPHEKLTIREATEKVNAVNQNKFPDLPALSEATVRRAITELEEKGFLNGYGRQNNARLFGKPSAAQYDSDRKLVPFAGELKSVEEFIRIMTDPEERPFTRNTSIIGEKMQHAIRRQMAYVVMSSIDPGFSAKVKDINANLYKLAEDLEHALKIITSFIKSPVWYEQYRDQMAAAVREFQKNDPEAFQLTLDYIKSGD